ncbi:tail assembly protein [Metapseudomonas otitidis]|uniref:tail assembly protein n=1 Tax=Metapseudomonas otitidis TaxID=319939 RepID=UPI001CA3D16E|nr:tail assembly protein [Pseudomonas otitidis]QZX85359.1 tail assembly protein [Pseudomonas otitidis]WIF69761.1 tail assembly protein [Pseudomonas otitidis]
MQQAHICTILLSGRLAKLFGREHRRQLDTGSTWEAFSALRNTIPGFREEIERAARHGQRYAVFRNRRNEGVDAFELGGTREIRIVPVLVGSKRGGILQTIIGAVLIVAGMFTGQAWAVQAGVALAIGGVIQMLSPQAKGLKGRQDTENQPSYAFGGAVNTTAMGNPVALGYGKRRIGGAIVSAGIYAEDIA